MELLFEEEAYDRLEVDAGYSHGFPVAVVALYRSRLQLLRAVHHRRDLAAMRCLDFRPLRHHSRRQHSIRLDNAHELLVEVHLRSDDTVAQIVVLRIDTPQQ